MLKSLNLPYCKLWSHFNRYIRSSISGSASWLMGDFDDYLQKINKDKIFVFFIFNIAKIKIRIMFFPFLKWMSCSFGNGSIYFWHHVDFELFCYVWFSTLWSWKNFRIIILGCSSFISVETNIYVERTLMLNEHLWFLTKDFVSRNVMGHLSAFTTQHLGVRDTQQVVNVIIITKYD